MNALHCVKSVRIFPHSVFSPNAGKYGSAKLRTRTFSRSVMLTYATFTQHVTSLLQHLWHVFKCRNVEMYQLKYFCI